MRNAIQVREKKKAVEDKTKRRNKERKEKKKRSTSVRFGSPNAEAGQQPSSAPDKGSERRGPRSNGNRLGVCVT
jgi:hypothetical protein